MVEGVVGIGGEDHAQTVVVVPVVGSGLDIDVAFAGEATEAGGAVEDFDEVVAILKVVAAGEVEHLAGLIGGEDVSGIDIAAVVLIVVDGRNDILVADGEVATIVGKGVDVLTDFEDQVVDIDRLGARGRFSHTQSNVVAVACIRFERNGILGHRRGEVDGLDEGESIGISRITHHTHFEVGAGAVASFEGEVEVGHVGGNLRHHSILVAEVVA